MSWCCVVVVLVGLSGTSALAQMQLGGLGRPAQAERQYVQSLTDAVEVKADKPQDVELVFRVLPGFHINSHTPKDELLIPTVLKIEPGSGLRELSEQYPQGKAFHLAIGTGETLDVYEDEFRMHLRVRVPRGSSTLMGELHYQACDTVSCYPPRTLPVLVAVTGR